MSNKPYLLVAGCSHTEGAGIDPTHVWAQQLAKSLNWDLINFGKNGACAKFVADSITDWMSNASVAPEIIIVQWPNPYRTMKVIDKKTYFYNANSMDRDFAKRFKYNPKSFVKEWQDNIIDLNSIFGTTLINLCFESNDQDHIIQTVPILFDQKITLHVDEKLPGKTWHFDSSAADKLHHSKYCHQKWADRVLNIINKRV
jgi:hypothetical protein